MGLVVNWPTNREVKPRKNVKTTCFVFTNIFIMNARYHFNAVLYIYLERLNGLGRKFKSE